MQSRKNYNKNIFLSGAIWNWGMAVIFISLSIINKKLLLCFLNKIPESMAIIYAFSALVFVFGLGYYWTSMDIQKNRDIIKMGILGKAAVFIIFSVFTFIGEVTLTGLAIAIVDLIFAGLFMEILMKI